MVFGLFKKKGPVSGASTPDQIELTREAMLIEGLEIAFMQSGPKENAVVFIHGNSACKEVFAKQVPVILAAGYGVLAVDLPGHGASGDAVDPDVQYTIPFYAELLETLCGRLGMTSPVLCGWSLGGHIAIEMAARRSAYRGLMIFGTPPVGPGAEHLEAAFLTSDVSDVTGAEAPPRERLQAYISALYGSLQTVPEPFRRAGLRADGRSRSCMFAHWLSGESGHDQRALVQAWQKPILMIHGGDDAFISEDYLRTLDVPGDGTAPTLIVIDKVGHAPFLEAPDRFNALLLEFCRRSFI